MKKLIIYSVLVLFCVQQKVIAQGTRSKKAADYFRIAEKEFKDLRYMYSIPFYRTSLKYPGKNDSAAVLHLAEAYWHTRIYDSAKLYFEKFEARFGTQLSSSRRIAELAASRKDYATAVSAYQKLLNAAVSEQNNNLLKERLKGFSNPGLFLRDSLDYNVRLLLLNTRQQDFSPQFYHGGMVFVSNRFSKIGAERQFGWDGLPYANIFWVKDTADLLTVDSVFGYTAQQYKVDLKATDDNTAQTSNDNDIILVSSIREGRTGNIRRLEKFSDQLNSNYNYGPLCFNKAQNKVYFTRNALTASSGRYNLEICEATLRGSEWVNTKVMPFVQAAFDFYHPAISPDDKKLYFCSNKPGGKGGSDIYYADLSSDSLKAISVLADDQVNTAGDELFPTFFGDTLYYSSDGLAGLGGLDIYKTYQEKGSWKKPVNLGYPVNSSFDDFGIIFNPSKNKGFLSSNRLGTDDIFSFNYAPFFVQVKGTVLSRSTLRRLDSVKVAIHTVVDDKPVIDSFLTNITGNFHFPVKPGQKYSLDFSRYDYIDTAYSISMVPLQTELILEPALLSQVTKPAAVPQAVVEKDRDGDGVPDVKDKCPGIKGLQTNDGCPDIQARINELAKMVFFKTASAELTSAALRPLNEVADIIKGFPNVTLTIEGHTDNRAPAPYNLDLSKRRSASVKNFFISKGFAANRFSTAGFGLERPIADNTTEKGRAMNRRVAIQAAFNF